MAYVIEHCQQLNTNTKHARASCITAEHVLFLASLVLNKPVSHLMLNCAMPRLGMLA